ncbi:hypothetical protein L207DRAFT_578331 [Hyaloscypha variabilis F]|uniref:Uncharacterized protein n=1 Tax=Hyaloscypha variabilis (strain UAMH 11265 / GT02V1 / F) TaxID=1149755 RepID=A0A2J6S3S1_HYAVF|nr:hypothetical protein L207DRAFT_578331 [Hyaloscypha variabilis F]
MGGHHKAWIAAAHAIEQADKPLVPAAHGHSDGEFLSECIEQDAILGHSLNFELNKETGLAAAVQNGAKLPPDPELRIGNPENMEDLRKFFNIFNSVLFNGVLTGYDGRLHWYERAHDDIDECGYAMELRMGKEQLDSRFPIQHPLTPIWIRKNTKQRWPTAKIGD